MFNNCLRKWLDFGFETSQRIIKFLTEIDSLKAGWQTRVDLPLQNGR